MKLEKKFGMFVAAAIVRLLSSCVTAPPPGSPAEVGMCHGANSCRGKAQCGGQGSSCASKNACRGQGWIKATREECAKAAGRFDTGDTHD